MKLYLSDEEKLKVYSLPKEVENSYTISHSISDSLEENITFLAKDGKWYIKGDYNTLVYSNIGTTQIDEDVLEINKEYQIQFVDIGYQITIRCTEDSFDYYDYDLGSNDSIILSNDTSGNICYEHTNILTKHYKIYRYNNQWVFEDSGYNDSHVYINGFRARKAVISIGDVIYTCGFKLIWMGLFIRINNPNNKILLSLNKYQGYGNDIENKYTPVKENEKGITLYNDNQTFFHTPRIKFDISEKKITIEDPPTKEKNNREPAIFTYGASLVMGLSSSFTGFLAIMNIMSGKATILSSITEITMCVGMLAGTILLPIAQDKYHIVKEKRLEKKRQKKYGEYLEKKKNEIKDELENESSTLFKNDLSSTELLNSIVKLTSEIWSREIKDEDFLTFRVGLGDRKSNIEMDSAVKEFTMDNDNLRQAREDIVKTPLVLSNVPITTSLIENRIMSLIISYNFQNRQYYINNIMLQLITYYSGADLKIIVLTTENNERYWNYFKYLPHCISDDRSTRFFASTEEETKQLCSNLEQIYQERITLSDANNSSSGKDISSEFPYKNFNQYYLVITDNYLLIKKYGIINKIIESDKNFGFSLLTIEPTMQNVPSKCNGFIQVGGGESCLLKKDNKKENRIVFQPEYLYANIEDYSRILANIPITVANQAANLPTSISFLEMYKVGNINQLNIFNRWTENDPTVSLHTPIGVHENGKQFELDLHEKYHGPHGLIAGSTGSGKSEFIITYILSMAVNYHPYEVQFVLIDYKGGGLAGAFENRETGIKIPHLVGTITNLDKASMNRTLISIQSELQRRQRLFNSAREYLGESTIDIYKYQKFYREGKLKEPCSHLFIIADEFAELKDQQPDFMDNLVSAARIGRSLGVHLILATQKPSGVVNDQIWSNTKFRVCLKVQTAEDSNEMLKRPEAASIKETGRFYLQVGYDELFEIGQSGWAGAKYVPSNNIIKTINDSIDFINNSGTTLLKINDTDNEKMKQQQQTDLGDQLTNIVKTLYNIAVEKEIKFNQLWLDNVPTVLYLDNLLKKYNRLEKKPYNINIMIGEYDDPANQSQGYVSTSITKSGNIAVCGLTGMGKTTLLSTIIYSSITNYSSDEINIYIVDLGSEALKKFAKAPQVGDFVGIDNVQKIKYLFHMIESEIQFRQKYYSSISSDFLTEVKNGKAHFPNIMVVLHGYDVFKEMFFELDEKLVSITRSCTKFGINFIITSTSPNAFTYNLLSNISTKILLNLSDPIEYSDIFPNSKIIPSNNPGRGLIEVNEKCVEFQTAIIFDEKKEKVSLDYVIDTLNEYIKTKAKPISTIPKHLRFDSLKIYMDDLANIPMGINLITAQVSYFELTKLITLTSSIQTNALKRFSYFFSRVLTMIPNTKLIILNSLNDLKFYDSPNIKYYDANFSKISTVINTNIEKLNKTYSDNKFIVIILGYLKINSHLKSLKENDDNVYSIDDMILNCKNDNFKFILYEKSSNLQEVIDGELSDIIDNQFGIWVGPDFDMQDSFDCDRLNETIRFGNDDIILIEDAIPKPVKIPTIYSDTNK